MNGQSLCPNTIFKNPENKPLDQLKLELQSEGVTEQVPALDKRWMDKRKFLFYIPPKFHESNGQEIIGAKESWLEVAGFILQDLKWLLQLPFYKFWSNIAFNGTIVDMLLSFLLESPTYYTYENFPNDSEVRNLFNEVRHKVLVVYARIVTSKESNSEYMERIFHGNLIYDKYIFSIPVALDLCQLYGRDNRKIVERIISSAFSLQKCYSEDLEKTVTFLAQQTLKNFERRFEDCPVDLAGMAVPLTERGSKRVQTTLEDLEDEILHFLDTISTINIFMSIYSPAKTFFKDETFISKLLSVYGNSIPELYKTLDNLAFKDESIEKYMELKHRLDVSRVEVLNVYRSVIYFDIENLKKSEKHENFQIEEIIDEFLNNITNSLNEPKFVLDYNNYYPFMEDYEELFSIYKNLDTIKCQFIVDSIYTTISENQSTAPGQPLTSGSYNLTENAVGPSNSHSNEKNDEVAEAHISNGETKSETEIFALILEVKDVLCDLGEGFIQKCLKHYNYNSASVINAVLEDNLPVELKNVDRSLPYIPPDPDEASASVDNALGIQRLNIYDNDEFDVMTKDFIDTTRVHRGKKKDEYKSLNELLNDKTHIEENRDFYNKFSIVTSEYDDEYDDTYDAHDVGPTEDEVLEMDARPFTVPRVLQKHLPKEDSPEEQEQEVDAFAFKTAEGSRDNFIQDPAILREKAEERRMKKYGGHVFYSQNKNVTGVGRGQGQSKEVLDNRSDKNKNKASRGNHNRRAGSQWKRSRGMVPS